MGGSEPRASSIGALRAATVHRPWRIAILERRRDHPTNDGTDSMGAKKRRDRQRPVKGFRPGKEPAHLKKKRAKARLGPDASWAQKQTVEAVAGRSPEEVRRMVRRWSLGLVIGGLILVVLGAALYGWSVPAGVAVHVVSLALLLLGYRVRKQGAALVEMADSM